jgi:hypothetical protein
MTGKNRLRKESKIETAVEDICLFHRYLDRIKSRRQPYAHDKEIYERMEVISGKYPFNNSLKNLLDEAERIIWLYGKPEGVEDDKKKKIK